MASKIVMPQLGESVVEGTIVTWLVKVGDLVENGTLLVEVETDKANAEVPSTERGYVKALLAANGDIVAVGQPIIELVANASELGGAPAAAPAPAPSPAPAAAPAPAPAPAAAPAPAPAPAAAPAPAPAAAPAPAPAAAPAPALVTSIPATSNHAWNRDGVVAAPGTGSLPLPLASAGSPPLPAELARLVSDTTAAVEGPFGTPAGMKNYKVPPVQAGPNDTVIKFSKRRSIISEHMVYSKHVSPHVPCFAEVDMSAVSELRRVHKGRLEKEGISLTILAFVLKATTMALREFPGVNAVVGNGEVIQRGDIHLGVAVETDGGLVVPVIRNADQLSTGGLAKAVVDVADKARDKKITLDDLSGGTFTVSNPGRRGNLFGAAIINQPQVGILRMGEIVRRPVVRTIAGEEVICIRSMMYLSLSYDHRIIDGVQGNGFLFRIRELLEAGQFDI
jgi:2-oxoglutarate dehydrogenase E2 component (dihydrolipoamide succinyltransferase)